MLLLNIFFLLVPDTIFDSDDLIALADLEALFFFLSLTTCSMILVCHSKI